jgi:hypothetical protein
MKVKPDDLADEALLAELQARLARSTKPSPDWIDAYRDGELLRTDECAAICDTSTETIRRRLSDADEMGQPIGLRFADVWLVSRRRLLADIERRKGLPERLAAESRAEKILKTRLPPHLSPRFVGVATG